MNDMGNGCVANAVNAWEAMGWNENASYLAAFKKIASDLQTYILSIVLYMKVNRVLTGNRGFA